MKHLVVGLGELLWDEVGDDRHPGGATANVAFQANQLGNRGVIISRAGTDEPGDAFVQFLEEQGLETDWIQRDGEHPTGRATVAVGDDGQPDFTIHRNVAWDHLEYTDEAAALVAEADAVCFGTLAQRSDESRETIQKLLDAAGESCLRVFDVNIRQHFFDRDTLIRSLEHADVVKLNSDEVHVLADRCAMGTAVPGAFAAQLEDRFQIKVVCITRGSEGCLAIGDGERVDVPGTEVEVEDSIGAGDAFTAGLITGLLKEWSLNAAVRFANRVGALSASRAGAMPTLASEYAELTAEFEQA